MIDLHIHTNYSDGTDTVMDILKKAEELKLEIISITDHDKVDAHLEIETIDSKEYYRGVIIKGVELRSIYQAVPIEILGYGINVKKIKNSKYVIDQAGTSVQEEYLEKMKQIGKKIGLRFEDNIHIDKNNVFASSTFGKEITTYPENREIIEKYQLGTDGNLFYRNAQSNPNSIFYIDESESISTPEKMIDEIHHSGGVAFLAHPLIYPFGNKLQMIEQFIKEYNIDGLECYYSLFSKEETQDLINLCNKYHLFVSGGSDYHGLAKPDINMGTGRGNLNITKAMLGDWIERVQV